MEILSIIFGIISFTLCSCLYISIPTGALAILFALLSRGPKIELSPKAKLGLTLGILGLVVTIIFYTYAFYVAIGEYGSLENLLRASCEMYGYDFEALFGDYFTTPQVP